MIFDGIKFRAVRTIVPLNSGFIGGSSLTDEQIDALVADGTFIRKPHGGYLIPGRIVPEGTKGSFRAEGWTLEGKPVYAKPMKITGWSLTNMVYVKDRGENRVVLFANGGAYIA